MFVSPIIQSLQRLDTRRDFGVIALYGILLALFVCIGCLPFSNAVQTAAVEKFHLTLKPFGRWAAAQFVPAMYNFKNKLFWSLEPLDGDLHKTPYHLSVNHYPMRMLYFTTNRKAVVFQKPLYIYLSSVYRGREFITSYMISTTPQNIHVQYLNANERSHR